MNTVKESKLAHPGWIVAALVVLTIAAYSSVGSLDFFSFDDPQYITENPQVSQGLSWQGVEWAFTTGQAFNWHPLTWISHMVDVELVGLSSGPHHLEKALSINPGYEAAIKAMEVIGAGEPDTGGNR